MKHAGSDALERLLPLLTNLRALTSPLVERKPGVFYLQGKACLHFHDDPTGLFADLRLSGDDFDRFPVTTTAQQRALVATIKKHFNLPRVLDR